MNTGIKISVGGIELTVSSVDEAAELIRKIRQSETKSRTNSESRTESPSPPSYGQGSIFPVEDRAGLEHALAFLTAIWEAGASGVEADAMMKVLHVDHPKGIGGRAVKINNILTKIGFRPEQVYRNPRLPEGRVWKRGPKFQEALEAIKRSKAFT